MHIIKIRYLSFCQQEYADICINTKKEHRLVKGILLTNRVPSKTSNNICNYLRL